MNTSEVTPFAAAGNGSRGVQLRSNFRRSSQGREIVIVLGMHRSGTSLLSNILHLLGIDMVDQPTHASKSNETGFWERPEIVALHDDILQALGAPVGSPMHAVPLKAGWWRNPKIRDLKKRMHDVMATHLAQVRRPWGFKDPRTCRLLPLWGEILEELDVSPRFVWAVRHPAEAAASMSLKNPQARPIPVAQSEVMWLAYNYDILRHAGRHWPIIVPYDSWFEDPAGLARELGQELDVMWRGSDHELDGALSELINAESRHHWAGHGKLKPGLAVSNDVYGAILALRGGPASSFDERTAVALQSVLAAVQPFAAEARDLRPLKDEVLRVSKEAEQHLVSLAEAEYRARSLQDEIAGHDKARTDAEANALGLRSAVEALETALSEAEAERARQVDLLAKNNEAAGLERQQLLDDLAASAGELSSAQAKLAEAQASLHTSTRHLTLLGGERDGLRAELAGLAAARDGLQRALKSAQSECAAAARELSELRQAGAALSAELDKVRTELASVSASRSSAKKAVSALQGELDGLRETFEAESAKHQELMTSFETTAADRERLLAALAEVEAQLATTASERQALMIERDEAREVIEAMRQQLAQASAAETELTKKASGYLTEIDRLRAETLGIETARDEQLHLAARYRDELEAMDRKRETEANSALAEQNELRLQLETVSRERSEIEERLADVAESHETLLVAHRALEQSLDEVSLANARWREDHEKASRERDGLAEELEGMRRDHAILEERIGAGERKQNLLAEEGQRQTGQLREEIAAVLQERESIRAAMEAEIAGRRGEIERLRIRLSESAVAEATAREAARATVADMTKMKAELAGLRAALRGEREKLAAIPLAKPQADSQKQPMA
jgi:DNA repair exonuclease SbcCD ATPase subunit